MQAFHAYSEHDEFAGANQGGREAETVIKTETKKEKEKEPDNAKDQEKDFRGMLRTSNGCTG